MSVVQALQNYLRTYPGMEIQPISFLHQEIPMDIYSLATVEPDGDFSVKEDMGGQRTYDNSYVIYAKETSLAEQSSLEAYELAEHFCEWLEEQSDSDNLPVLPEPYVAESLIVSKVKLIRLNQDGTGLYQIKIKLSFSKRRF